MSGFLSTPTLSPGLLAPTPTTPAADLARSQVRETARKFESQFMAQMIGHMFEGVKTDGPFGGGFGEDMFRSVMVEAIANQMTRAGGIGLSDTIQREMLKMQGLT